MQNLVKFASRVVCLASAVVIGLGLLVVVLVLLACGKVNEWANS